MYEPIKQSGGEQENTTLTAPSGVTDYELASTSTYTIRNGICFFTINFKLLNTALINTDIDAIIGLPASSYGSNYYLKFVGGGNIAGGEILPVYTFTGRISRGGAIRFTKPPIANVNFTCAGSYPVA